MTLSISNTVVTCYSEPDQFLSSSQLAFSRSVQEFCQESVSCSAILGLALGRTLGILAKSQSFHLFSSWGNAQSRLGLSRFGSAAIGFAFEGASFHSISTWGATGTFQIGAWNENLHSALTLALCHGIGRKFSSAGIPIQHLMQNGGMVTLDLSLEYFHIVEQSHQGIVERFCNAEIMSFRMEISAKFLATTCPQVSYIQAKMEIQTKVSERRIEKRERGTESFGQEFATINGASVEELGDYLKAERDKRRNIHHSNQDKELLDLLNAAYPGEPARALEALERLRILPQGEIDQIRAESISLFKSPPWFKPLHESIDRFLKGKENLSTEEQTAFRLLVEYTVWSTGEWNHDTVSFVYTRSFPRLRNYFTALVRFVEEQIDYAQKVARTSNSIQVESARFSAHRTLTHYLATRDTADSSETFLASLLRSSKELLNPYWTTHKGFSDFVEKQCLYLDFLSRRIAAEDALMAEHTPLIRTHFPLAEHFRSGIKHPITWREIEEVRKTYLPSTEGKPLLMIVGIGREWEQVERYAQEGYNLVLVDRSDMVEEFFQSKGEAIKELERKHSITIQYLKEDIESLQGRDDLKGSLSCIEYQNAKGIGSTEEINLINWLLKPGGIFVQFNPTTINSPGEVLYREYEYSKLAPPVPLFSQYHYEILIDRNNLPGVLGTLSERQAYPLGNHLFMAQKPVETVWTSEDRIKAFLSVTSPASSVGELFAALPEKVAQTQRNAVQVALENELFNSLEVDAFVLFIEQATLGREAPLSTEEISDLFYNSFPQQRTYFLGLLKFSREQIYYQQTIRNTFELIDEEASLFTFHRMLSAYLSHRERRGVSVSMRNSVGWMLENSATLFGFQFTYREHGTSILFDFISRKIAENNYFYQTHQARIERDFPLADYYRRGKTNRITWEEFESERRSHLPTSIEKPLLMLVGIGQEWKQVVRYAEAGYRLVLVDPNPVVARFFDQRAAEIRELERTYSTSIQYEAEGFGSSELANFYQGQIDCIEYQNAPGIGGLRGLRLIDQMLKTGGLLVQFNPRPIFKPDPILFKEMGNISYAGDEMEEIGFKVVFDRRNIPSVLGTASEQFAYPLGNYLFIAKKLT